MPKGTKKRTVIYSNVKANKKKAEQKSNVENNQINLNDEVIIGFNSKKDNKNIGSSVSVKQKDEKKQVVKTKNKPGKQVNKNTKMTQNTNKKNIQQKQKMKKNVNVTRKNDDAINKQVRKNRGPFKVPVIFKIGVAAIVIVIATFAFLKSPVFNIEEIKIKIDHNTVLTESEIKELSNIVVGQNMFSISKKKSIESIETNSYVEAVKIKRKIPNKLEIEVVERTIAFQIEVDGGYAYIDNYGVVIDQKNDKKDCIVITGHKTENIITGEKLNDEDIRGLSDVLVIIQEAKNNEVIDDITKIDISNHDDYLVYFDNLGKVAHIGDITSINDKMTRIAKILKVESEVEGEIFVNVDFNNGKYPYFREKV